jgi:hypothetical protein
MRRQAQRGKNTFGAIIEAATNLFLSRRAHFRIYILAW